MKPGPWPTDRLVSVKWRRQSARVLPGAPCHQLLRSRLAAGCQGHQLVPTPCFTLGAQRSLTSDDLFAFLLIRYWVSCKGASLVAQTVKKTHLRCRKCEFDPWVVKIPWRREWQLTPVFLPGESHGQRSLVGSQSMGSQRVRHRLIEDETGSSGEGHAHTRACTHTHTCSLPPWRMAVWEGLAWC